MKDVTEIPQALLLRLQRIVKCLPAYAPSGHPYLNSSPHLQASSKKRERYQENTSSQRMSESLFSERVLEPLVDEIMSNGPVGAEERLNDVETTKPRFLLLRPMHHNIMIAAARSLESNLQGRHRLLWEKAMTETLQMLYRECMHIEAFILRHTGQRWLDRYSDMQMLELIADLPYDSNTEYPALLCGIADLRIEMLRARLVEQ